MFSAFYLYATAYLERMFPIVNSIGPKILPKLRISFVIAQTSLDYSTKPVRRTHGAPFLTPGFGHTTASFRTVFHLRPDGRPFFAPREGALTDRAHLFRQIDFFAHATNQKSNPNCRASPAGDTPALRVCCPLRELDQPRALLQRPAWMP